MDARKENVRIQQWVLVVAIALFIVKVIAYLITHSVAILTDALEGTVNVAAGIVGLYSLWVAAKPSDKDHPYGHGKAEFLSSAVEGTLITVAGFLIVYEAIKGMLFPRAIEKLDSGIILISITAAVNFILGHLTIHRGRKNNSLALVASGKHLKTDTYTTVGIIIGLGAIYITKLHWLDSAVAIIFAFIIIYTGYKIVRQSIAGIMDEADTELLSRMIELINENRRENWIDMHNLRVIKYGGQLHVDAHITVPWYLNVHEAHIEIDAIGELIRKQFGDSLELFVHSDGCLYYQCNICSKENCPVRQADFEKRMNWNMNNVLSNKKHSMEEVDS
ncbi:MAG TPA: cation diffusion facilitator family transporter [Flavitalea sp.]|nr:cation diffusion facilitator family transporter [Flavitalea sp.]